MKLTNSIYFTALIMFFVTMISTTKTNACTSAIFSGKVTADGRPLMWKHRDTGQRNNRVKKYKGEKYDFIALVNSNTKDNSAWSGTNSVGFSIMNTHSYNISENKKLEKTQVSHVMFQALSKCATLLELEELLHQFDPLALETNLAAIDAYGGAAYYECGDTSWIKMDVNDPSIAPLGYLTYTNHSFTGDFDQGMGYVRYNTAISIINDNLNIGRKITPLWVASNLSRSFRHSLLGIDLSQTLRNELQDNTSNLSGYFIDQDFIPRRSSTAVTIVHGVKPNDDPGLTVMYTILGYPPLGITIPLMVNQKLPEYMIASKESQNAPMCDIVLAVKDKEIFNITRGNGQSYFNFKILYKKYMKQVAPIETELFNEFNILLDKWRNNQKTSKEELSNIYTKAYNNFQKALE